jgi:hypothetical protein
VRNLSPLALSGTLAVLVAFALMGVLLVAPGSESTYRLGLLFGVIGTAIAAVVGMLKADQSATQTNGKLDQRIEYAVHTALDKRRRGDPPTPPDQLPNDAS